CTLISTSRLPPSVPHFYLGAFGLDTSRYAFLGRVRMLNDRAAQVIASDSVYTAPVDSVMTVWARSAEPRRTAGYLLRIHRIATILGAVLLLQWSTWAPRVVRLVLKIEDRVARLVAGLQPEPVTGYTGAVAAARLPDRRTSSLGLLFMLIGIGVLGTLRPLAVGGALLVIFVAMLAWIGVEYLRPQRRGREPSATPTEVLRSEPGDNDWARRAAIIIAACGVPLSVIARQLAVFATATLLVLYIVALLVWRVERAMRRTADAGPRLRLGAPLLTLA